MKNRITSLGLPAALLSASLFAACQNTARGVEQDAEQNAAEAREETREARQEAREAEQSIKREGREAGEAMERAGDRIANETKQGTRSVGATLDAAAQTMQITSKPATSTSTRTEQPRP
jgi:predicted small secreted protein